jgi:hypothetical protein
MARRREGRVVAVNARRSVAVVQLDDGKCCVFRWVDCPDVEAGDKVSGDLSLSGGRVLLNRTKGFDFVATIEHCDVTLPHALAEIA